MSNEKVYSYVLQLWCPQTTLPLIKSYKISRLNGIEINSSQRFVEKQRGGISTTLLLKAMLIGKSRGFYTE
jgi:hypothetical protein